MDLIQMIDKLIELNENYYERWELLSNEGKNYEIFSDAYREYNVQIDRDLIDERLKEWYDESNRKRS